MIILVYIKVLSQSYNSVMRCTSLPKLATFFIRINRWLFASYNNHTESLKIPKDRAVRSTNEKTHPYQPCTRRISSSSSRRRRLKKKYIVMRVRLPVDSRVYINLFTHIHTHTYINENSRTRLTAATLTRVREEMQIERAIARKSLRAKRKKGEGRGGGGGEDGSKSRATREGGGRRARAGSRLDVARWHGCCRAPR